MNTSLIILCIFLCIFFAYKILYYDTYRVCSDLHKYSYNDIEKFQVDGYNSIYHPKKDTGLTEKNQDAIIRKVLTKTLLSDDSIESAISKVSYPAVYISSNYNTLSPVKMQNESSVKIALQRFFNSAFNSRSLTTDERISSTPVTMIITTIENVKYVDINPKDGSVIKYADGSRFFMFDAMVVCSDSTNVNVFTKTFNIILTINDYFKYFSGRDYLEMSSEPPIDNYVVINVSLNNVLTSLINPEPMTEIKNDLYYITNSLGLLDPFSTSANTPYKPLTRNKMSSLKDAMKIVLKN